tara:strand:+ start:35 stop:313 length:279 start_codon:yes stop_codon:yes gene_type:complete
MNKSWQEERKEIAVWLSGYLGMVNNWVDKILIEEDIDKNKILSTLSDWIEYLSDERQKIMMLKDKPIKEVVSNDVHKDSIGPNDPGDEVEIT